MEAEQRAVAARPSSSQQMAFVAAAAEAARNLDLDEADTRLLIDDQLRQAGWEADTPTLRHGAGVQPERGRRMAIAEWPSASGPADYALFIGEALVGLVEAKRKRRDVAAALDQAERYARGLDWRDGGSSAGGPWGEHRAPFAFATNGRSFYPQFATQIRVRVTAQDVILSRDRPMGLSALNILSGRIADIRLGEGPGALVTLCVGDDRLIARITRRSAGAMGPFTGQTCHAMIRSVAVAPEDVGTGRQS